MLLRIDLRSGTVVDALSLEPVGVVTPTRDPDKNHVQISVGTWLGSTGTGDQGDGDD